MPKYHHKYQRHPNHPQFFPIGSHRDAMIVTRHQGGFCILREGCRMIGSTFWIMGSIGEQLLCCAVGEIYRTTAKNCCSTWCDVCIVGKTFVLWVSSVVLLGKVEVRRTCCVKRGRLVLHCGTDWPGGLCTLGEKALWLVGEDTLSTKTRQWRRTKSTKMQKH